MTGGVLGIQPHYDLLFYPDQSGRTQWLRIRDLLDSFFSGGMMQDYAHPSWDGYRQSEL